MLERTAHLEIIDNAGKVVRKWVEGTLVNEMNQVTLDLGNLPVGSYFLRVLESGESEVFLVQR